jgi:hypothetical protein|tara:strand:+ start:8110 stop:8493 length:384 start_codon:yes stop_codon:yes gene_type:complete
MGRYYWGDIEGKFWFAVQSSDDASNFGVEGKYHDKTQTIDYEFQKEDLLKVDEQLLAIKYKLGSYMSELNEFFEKNNGYNDEMLVEQTNIPAEEVSKAMQLYARYGLGVEIRDCILKNGSCMFEAEC